MLSKGTLVLSLLGCLCNDHSVVWVWELVEDTCTDGEGGIFPGRIGKRVLKWPKHHSTTALVVVGMQKVRSTILERKLGFLQKVLNAGSKCVNSRLVEAITRGWCSFLLKRKQIGAPILYTDEPQQRGGDSPSTLVSQIVDCPAAIESFSKALVPSLLASLHYEGNAAQHYEGNVVQQYQSNAAQLYEGSATQQYRSTAAQHSQSNAAQLQGNAAQPYWGNIALPPAFLGNVTQGWMGSVPPAPVGNAASFHMGNVANPYHSNAAQQGTSTAVDQHQWRWTPWGPYPYHPEPSSQAGRKRRHTESQSSDSDGTDEDDINPYLTESECRDLLSDSQTQIQIQSRMSPRLREGVCLQRTRSNFWDQ